MSRRVIMLAALATAVVVLAWYFLLWSPMQSDIDAARERRETAEDQESSLQSQINRLREAQRQEPLRRAQVETLRTAIPDTPNLSQFILDVNDAATRAGIRFISIAPSEPRAPAAATATTTTTAPGAATPTTAGGATTPTTGAPRAAAPAEIGLAFQIEGGYFQVLDFINRLDRLPRLVVIDSLNVAAGETGALTVGLSARMFVRSIPAGFAGASPTTSAPPGGGTTTTAPGGTPTTAAGGTATTAAGGAATTTTTAGARP